MKHTLWHDWMRRYKAASGRWPRQDLGCASASKSFLLLQTVPDSVPYMMWWSYWSAGLRLQCCCGAAWTAATLPCAVALAKRSLDPTIWVICLCHNLGTYVSDSPSINSYHCFGFNEYLSQAILFWPHTLGRTFHACYWKWIPGKVFVQESVISSSWLHNLEWQSTYASPLQAVTEVCKHQNVIHTPYCTCPLHSLPAHYIHNQNTLPETCNLSNDVVFWCFHGKESIQWKHKFSAHFLCDVWVDNQFKHFFSFFVWI